MVPYGIAKDGLRVVLDAINPKGFGGPMVAFQVNLRTSRDPTAKDQGDVVEGEARGCEPAYRDAGRG